MLRSILSLYAHSASSEDVRESRPFYWMVMAVLAGLYILALSGYPALRAPERLIPFTVLMLVHAALHWNSPLVAGKRRASVLYLMVQGILAFVIPLIAQADFLVIGLFMALVGEAVGILWHPGWVAVTILGYLALAALDLFLLSGEFNFPSWGISVVPMTIFVILYVVMYGRQAQARVHAQELLAELETAHRQLAEYAARVQDLTLANERQRMARELHDTLAQGLAGLILQLEAANTHLASGRTDRTQAILNQAMARARATLADARRVIDDLRAGQTTAGNLETALREQVTHFTEATGIACTLDLALETELPESAREHALRAVAEGLTNIARHAQARQAWVTLKEREGTLIVELRDDGCGFDPAAIPPGHYGLLGIRERARLANGTLDISSAPGAGTTLRLQLPIGGTVEESNG